MNVSTRRRDGVSRRPALQAPQAAILIGPAIWITDPYLGNSGFGARRIWPHGAARAAMSDWLGGGTSSLARTFLIVLVPSMQRIRRHSH